MQRQTTSENLWLLEMIISSLFYGVCALCRLIYEPTSLTCIIFGRGLWHYKKKVCVCVMMLCHKHISILHHTYALHRLTIGDSKDIPDEFVTLRSCVVKCFSRITDEDYDYSSID